MTIIASRHPAAAPGERITVSPDEQGVALWLDGVRDGMLFLDDAARRQLVEALGGTMVAAA